LENYYLPDSGRDVVELLQEYGERAMILAGGSFVHGLAARDLLFGIDVFIDIQKLGLTDITVASEGLQIGAMVRFAELAKAPEIQADPGWGAVRDALSYPPVQIMNAATVGGSIAAVCPYFDLPTAWLAIGGKVTAEGIAGSKEISLKDFSTSLFESSLGPDEFLTGLTLPQPAPGSTSAFIKLETNANDLAIVNVAVQFILDPSGVCQSVRVALGGGVNERPLRSASAEKLLTGQKLTDALLKEAGEAIEADISPMADHRATAEYRSAMACVLTERALHRAIARLTRRS
jgi:CO/xanthine dehydrogenase FAD-binding subunit